MAENLLKEVLRYCKINKESLVKLLTTLGVNNYITICELKSKSFINKISELTEEEFDEIFLCKVGESEPDDDQSLKELNKQVSNKKYSQTLKDFSVLVRLQVGRQIYQLLSNNLPLPKTKTTDHYLQQYEYVNEGELQVNISCSLKLTLSLEFKFLEARF